MRDKEFFNKRLFTYMNEEMKQFIEELSSNKKNSFKEIGHHHVLHDALCLLYKKEKGEEFPHKPNPKIYEED